MTTPGTLGRLNPWLHGDLAEGGQYVTMTLLCLDPSADRVEYASAGHANGHARAERKQQVLVKTVV